MLEITAELNGSHLNIIVNGEIVRSLEVRSGGAYRFKYNGKEYHFIYEEQRVMRRLHKKLYLYPINEFTDNMIELNDN